MIVLLIVQITRLKSEKKINGKMLSKKEILDLGTKYTRLQIREIAATCKIDRITIIFVVKEMIKNNEIYAQYFRSTGFVVFNQQANIKEIDTLMTVYKEWESKEFGKK